VAAAERQQADLDAQPQGGLGVGVQWRGAAALWSRRQLPGNFFSRCNPPVRCHATTHLQTAALRSTANITPPTNHYQTNPTTHPPTIISTQQEVEAADYNEFFKATFGEFLDPLAHVHFNVEVRRVGVGWVGAGGGDLVLVKKFEHKAVWALHACVVRFCVFLREQRKSADDEDCQL